MADPKVNITVGLIDKVTGPLKGIKDSFSRAFEFAAGDLLARGVAGLAGAVVDLGQAAAGLVFDAAPLEGLQGAFDGLAQSAGTSSDALLTSLQEASFGMVQNRDLMTSFNKAAQLVSIDFAQQLPDAMQYLGKVSAATGQDMGFMMDSLVTGVGRLSPMILDNLGIQVDMTAANEAYAESLGISVEEMTKQQQQAALMAQVLEKLETNTAAMPEVTGSAAQQFASFQVALKNAGDEIGLALLPIAQDLIGVVVPLISEYLPPLVDWFTQTAGVIGANLAPALSTLAAWLGVNLPPVIAALAAYWTDTLQPALAAVWSFVQTNLIPVLQKVWDWISTNLPPALQKLSDFWNNTLLPALNAIWEFLSVDMMPVWEALGELIEVVIVGAFTALTDFWTNTLQPALQAIWQYLQDNIVPIFQSWSDGIGGIAGVIDIVVGKIGELTEWLSSITLPDWLTPGSPTPFELGLRGIAGAMDDLNRMQMPAFNANLTAAGIAAGSAGVTNQYNLTINEAGRIVDPAASFSLMKALARAG